MVDSGETVKAENELVFVNSILSSKARKLKKTLQEEHDEVRTANDKILDTN